MDSAHLSYAFFTILVFNFCRFFNFCQQKFVAIRILRNRLVYILNIAIYIRLYMCSPKHDFSNLNFILTNTTVEAVERHSMVEIWSSTLLFTYTHTFSDLNGNTGIIRRRALSVRYFISSASPRGQRDSGAGQPASRQVEQPHFHRSHFVSAGALQVSFCCY